MPVPDGATNRPMHPCCFTDCADEANFLVKIVGITVSGISGRKLTVSSSTISRNAISSSFATSPSYLPSRYFDHAPALVPVLLSSTDNDQPDRLHLPDSTARPPLSRTADDQPTK